MRPESDSDMLKKRKKLIYLLKRVALLAALSWPPCLHAQTSPAGAAPLQISGTYPHLAVFSDDGEIGIGAVAPWADRLWFVTYPPHRPQGSPDKLWTIDPDLTLTARRESIGGTHANRMIQRESNQLIIGPYVIDANANVRVIPFTKMPGRLTATARSLDDPAHKVYFFTMEKGLYEVDLRTLDVAMIYRDGNIKGAEPTGPYPGTHGKGGYTGQGRILLSNNGENGWNVGRDPHFNGPAGVLTEHTGTNWAEPWETVERKNFTEITGPGGIYGPRSEDDPIWCLGWDKRSAILKLLDHGKWFTYRIPKGSYTQDAFHGWFTEWPRIREVRDGLMLMHMNGMFYHFPKTFSAANTAGIEPICTFLKMPVDYCWWNGRIVMGRDDTSTTGGNRWAGQSHSAPWFGTVSDMEEWGPPAGVGGPWKEDAVKANAPSDPFLIAGFKDCVLHLKQGGSSPATFKIQFDADGTGHWKDWTNVTVKAGGYEWRIVPEELHAIWLRLVADENVSPVTAYLHLSNPPRHAAPELFAGLAPAGAKGGSVDGIIRPRSGEARTLEFVADSAGADGREKTSSLYEMDGDFKLHKASNETEEKMLRKDFSLERADFKEDEASVIYVEGGNRFRLPKSDAAYDQAGAAGWPRGAREVVTERFLFDAHGTFYEMPRDTSGGFRRIRPVTTHHKHISDFASWRGLLVMSGVSNDAKADGHVFRSEDGNAALWFGDVDDLWRMGPPSGRGGPWKETPVKAGVPSDPYLMYGYDAKSVELSHDGGMDVVFTVEVDFAADNSWSEYGRFTVPAGKTFKYVFPEGYSAHWARVKTDHDVKASAVFTYGELGR